MFDEPAFVLYCCNKAKFGETNNCLLEYFVVHVADISDHQKDCFGFTFNTVRNVLSSKQNWSGSTAL